MNADELHKSLTQLRGELHSAASLDDDSRQLLKDILIDAERLKAGTREAPGSWEKRLEAAAVRFEADHPTLGASIRELIGILGRAGI